MAKDLNKELETLDKELEELRVQRQELLQEAGIENAGAFQRGPRAGVSADGQPIIEKEAGIVDEITTTESTPEGLVVNEVGMDDILMAIRMFGKGGK